MVPPSQLLRTTRAGTGKQVRLKVSIHIVNPLFEPVGRFLDIGYLLQTLPNKK